MLDCLVIGGGQSGLLCGHLLARAGIDYRVLDAGPRAGEVWRQRPASLRLFTSRQFCRLADLPMPGDPEGYASGHEFADYLEAFARAKQVRVSFATRVARLSAVANGFEALLENGEVIRCRSVINATGSNQAPVVPGFAQKLDPRVVQLTAGEFRDAGFMPAGSRIAVVGDGASGRQIALELAAQHRVILACGRQRKLVPNRVLGKDVFWWLNSLGILSAQHDTWVAGIIRKRDPIPVASANNNALAQRGVEIRARAIDANETGLIFQDQRHEPVQAVIWCNGYREDTGWVQLPGAEAFGAGIGHEGRTSHAGFFLMGRKWLSCRASELVVGANNDAARVVEYVREYLGN
ncbi:flavin-containing monooxygenase [Pseudomonas sp. 20P_3.2_Bac5]|uniref:flavin-containing monooxygenase n=2 Tax=unclassified Pseudomonas TaxID=196821 RepID=UPI0021C5FDB4|nr:NAD(P)/FAD-dependent oxidoreductase [Pseudomonas sp. 20P_3.2_Bac5]MCU1747742.1 NAD(P)/FAD-dependent oxidoreductase [Pseudomonas sp. 20P_3.2_Bac5]